MAKMPFEGSEFNLGYDLNQIIQDTDLLKCIVVSLVMGLIVWIRLLTRNVPITYYFVILLISLSAGLVVRYFDYDVSLMDEAYDVISVVLVQMTAPLFLYYSSMGTDVSELSLNSGLTILTLLSLDAIILFLSTFIVWPLLHFSWDMTFMSTLLLMIMLTPKWAQYTTLQLDQVQGHIRDTQMILKFEQLCSIWLAYVLTEIIFRWQLLLSWPGYHPYHVITLIVYQCFGIILGAIFGIAIRIIFPFAYNDVAAQAIIIVSSLYIVQILAILLGTSQGLAVGIYGVILNSNKVKMSKDAEDFHAQLWEWYIFVGKTTISFIAGFILGLKRPGIIGFNHYGMILIIYCVLLGLRLIVLALARVWLTDQGEIHWKRVLIMGMGPFKGIPSLMLALQYTIQDSELGFQILAYVIGECSLSVFFNVLLFGHILEILGMFEYKRAAIVNMNIAVGQINTCRERAIFSQKMDIVIAGANWSIVEHLTRLPHPYKKKLIETGYAEDKGDFRLRTIICSSCGIEVVAPPTKGEIEDMIIEAKQRVLKIQLVSFGQQYENGTITRHSFRILYSVIDTAANYGTPVIDSVPLNIQTQESKVTRFFKRAFSFLTVVTTRTYQFVPQNIFRLLAFRISTSRIFNIVMAFLALADTAVILQLVMIWHFSGKLNSYREFTDKQLEFGRLAQICDFVFFIIFMVEFIVQLIGVGMVQYFSSHINKIETGSNLIRATELLLYLNSTAHVKGFVSVLLAHDVILLLKCLLLVRTVRIYVFIVGWLPRCLSLVEKQVEEELMRNYEVGKGYLVSLDRVMKFLSHVAIYETVYEAVKAEIEGERKKVAKDLGLIQKEYPSIAITVKTRHAIRYVINSVSECINDLKEDGILDLNENKAINDSLEKVKNHLRELPMVDPTLAQGVLMEIPWLNQDESQAELVMENAVLTSYDFNNRIINAGDDPVGLYVLVSGLVKAYYNPTSKSIQLNSKFGVLPNYDFFDVLRFDQQQDNYVVAGNVIGELGAVTGRRYDMTVVCETSVQIYFIPWIIIKNVVHESGRSIEIQNSIWKCIGVRLAVILVQSKPQFSDWSKERLLTYLDNGWVPPLNDIKCLNIVEDVADMILIEGVCKDSGTGKVYVGPYHLPKGITLLLLPDHPSWSFQTVYSTKLLIIPASHNMSNIVTEIFKEHYRINAHPELTTYREKKVGFDSGDSVETRSSKTMSVQL